MALKDTLKDPSSPQRKRWQTTAAHSKPAHQSLAMCNPFYMARLYGEAHELVLISQHKFLLMGRIYTKNRRTVDKEQLEWARSGRLGEEGKGRGRERQG